MDYKWKVNNKSRSSCKITSMSGEFSLIDWDNIVLSKKNVRSKNNVSVGNVVANYKDHILILSGVVNSHQYKIPKSTIESYNGSELVLKINHEDLKKFEINEEKLNTIDSTITDFFVKGLRCISGSVKIGSDNNYSLIFYSSDNKVSLNIIDPSIFEIPLGNNKNNKLTSILNYMKEAKAFARKLSEHNLTLSILNKDENVFTLGKDAHPSFSKLITRSNDIQIDSLKKSLKLASDIKKDE